MDPTRTAVLGSMDRAAFVLALERAEREAREARSTHEYLVTWAERLLPYLDADPAMTVATALERYRRAGAQSDPPRS